MFSKDTWSLGQIGVISVILHTAHKSKEDLLVPVHVGRKNYFVTFVICLYQTLLIAKVITCITKKVMKF